MTDEQQQPTTEVTQTVADSNAATVASLSTSVSTAQEVGGADVGEQSVPTQTVSDSIGGETSLPASDASSSTTMPSGAATLNDADATLADVGDEAGQQPDTDHPAKPHVLGLLRKIEAGEAIVLSEVESVLRRVKEML
ncbi:hypothetical protein QZM89_22305 [Burkholderia gladioli]|uniref:hypothetical protein n=1 Tax=Burkholderia gladioli TaxID=28095 RepID=UPI00264F57AB|nr:hypothetical protein [Burkholderia gladioli]MDN7497938.1 hypothetical protein [Burkholderia gladioli]